MPNRQSFNPLKSGTGPASNQMDTRTLIATFQSPQVGDRSCKDLSRPVHGSGGKFQSPQVGDRSCKSTSAGPFPSSPRFNPLKSGTGPASRRVGAALPHHEVSIPSSRGQVLQAEGNGRGRGATFIVSIPSSRGQVLQVKAQSAWYVECKFQSPQVGDRSCKGVMLYVYVLTAGFQSPQVGDRSCKAGDDVHRWVPAQVSIPSSRGQVLQAEPERSEEPSHHGVSIPSSRGQVLQVWDLPSLLTDIPKFQSPQVGDRSCKQVPV